MANTPAPLPDITWDRKEPPTQHDVANSLRVVDIQLHPTFGKTLRAHIAALTAENAYLKEVLDDKRRLAREIDVAMHGEDGAAKQPSLCDLIGPAQRLRSDNIKQQKRIGELTAALVNIRDVRNMATDDHTLAFMRGTAKAALASGEAEVCDDCQGSGKKKSPKLGLLDCTTCNGTGKKP